MGCALYLHANIAMYFCSCLYPLILFYFNTHLTYSAWVVVADIWYANNPCQISLIARPTYYIKYVRKEYITFLYQNRCRKDFKMQKLQIVRQKLGFFLCFPNTVENVYHIPLTKVGGFKSHSLNLFSCMRHCSTKISVY